MKIAVNRCYGGFSINKNFAKFLGIDLSELEKEDWFERSDSYHPSNEDFGIEDYNYYAYRSNPKFIKALEKYGVSKANSQYSNIEIVEIPDNIDWEIHDYDGMETVHEKHRSW